MFTVMVVEDNPDVAELFKLCLTLEGKIEVVVATSMEDALLTYHEGIHGLLVDFALGDGTGPELLKILGERAPKVAVLISGYDVRASEYPGFDDYLHKPIDCKELCARVTTQLERRVL